MVSRYATDTGGALLCLSGLLTGVYMLVSAVGFAALVLMVIAVGFIGVGVSTLSSPGRAPLFGVVGGVLAAVVFVGWFGDPLWAVPGVAGGVLCLVGGLAGRERQPAAQGQ